MADQVADSAQRADEAERPLIQKRRRSATVKARKRAVSKALCNPRTGSQIAAANGTAAEPDLLPLAIINSLASNLCVVDRSGRIIAVNTAWNSYAANNSAPLRALDADLNYLDVCSTSTGDHADEAAQFDAGVRAVINGALEIYECEYPCHSPWEDRWFLGRVTPLRFPGGGAVIEHVNITAHKKIAEELRKQAMTDTLTQLPNRRYFMDAGERELARVRRFKVPASVIMFDIDHFKGINDHHGHAGGDAALQHVAQACTGLARLTDTVGRLGGEEFAIVLGGTDELGAHRAAERFRELLCGLRIQHDGQWINLTASFGFSQISPNDVAITDALERADRALYAAKQAGRNRVMGPTMSAPV